MIFTLPALVVLKHWTSFNYWQTTVIAALGGMIGVLFTIPLRRALIAQSALKFPEGVATAEVLKVGDKGGAGIQMIFLGAVIGALFKLGDTGLKLWKGVVEGGAQLGGSIGYYGTNVSPALLAVGYIVGINIAVLVFLGGALNWYVAIPIVAASDSWPVYSLKEEAVGEAPARPATEEDVKPRPPWTVFELELAEEKPVTAEMTDAEMAEVTETNEAIRQANSELLAKVGTPVEAADYANKIWSKGTRFLGVGAMVVGGLWALLRLWKSLLASLVSSSRAYRSTLEGGEETIRRTDRDTPMKIVGLLLVVSAIPVFYVFEYVTKGKATSGL